MNDLEDLFENAPCGYLSLGPDGCIDKVNTTFCEWTGYAKNEVVGRHLRSLFTVASRIFYETHFAPLLRARATHSGLATRDK